MKYLLEKQNYCVHASDQSRGSLLHYAVARNNIDMVKYLLTRGASPYVYSHISIHIFTLVLINLDYLLI